MGSCSHFYKNLEFSLGLLKFLVLSAVKITKNLDLILECG